LTPTNTPYPTLIYTPDAWQATGTAIYLADNPPIEPTPTPDVPQAWCNNIPTHTPTMTALSLEPLAPLNTATFTPTMTPLKLGGGSLPDGQPVNVAQSAAPQTWDIILPTVGPPYDISATPRPPRQTKTPIIIIVTATPTPTLETTPEVTPETTPEATQDA
jgi:hypothetical protein